MECESEKQARGRRARWYQYIAACKRDANHPPAWMDKEKAIELVRKVMAVEIRLEGTKAIFCGRDNTPMMKYVRANMKIVYPDGKEEPAYSSAADESVAKLMTKLATKTMPE